MCVHVCVCVCVGGGKRERLQVHMYQIHRLGHSTWQHDIRHSLSASLYKIITINSLNLCMDVHMQQPVLSPVVAGYISLIERFQCNSFLLKFPAIYSIINL